MYQHRKYPRVTYISYPAPEFGKAISKFHSLTNFTYSFGHSLFDGEIWDNLVNGLNCLGGLVEVVVVVKNNFSI